MPLDSLLAASICAPLDDMELAGWDGSGTGDRKAERKMRINSKHHSKKRKKLQVSSGGVRDFRHQNIPKVPFWPIAYTIAPIYDLGVIWLTVWGLPDSMVLTTVEADTSPMSDLPPYSPGCTPPPTPQDSTGDAVESTHRPSAVEQEPGSPRLKNVEPELGSKTVSLDEVKIPESQWAPDVVLPDLGITSHTNEPLNTVKGSEDLDASDTSCPNDNNSNGDSDSDDHSKNNDWEDWWKSKFACSVQPVQMKLLDALVFLPDDLCVLKHELDCRVTTPLVKLNPYGRQSPNEVQNRKIPKTRAGPEVLGLACSRKHHTQQGVRLSQPQAGTRRKCDATRKASPKWY
ncbi:hypothetical protein FB451DRAFT_1187986 [Mycena latifolia]|nr:hypothetical protein FB451DRAFT_1187986 [Mycena latifolia]